MGLKSIGHVVSRKTIGSVDGVPRNRLILISGRTNTENRPATAIHSTQGLHFQEKESNTHTHTHTHTHRQTLDWRLIHGWDLTVELQRGCGIWLVYIARS
ncbi:hypothetical protein ACSBR1_030912 [Camellia fascicularis]